MKNRKLLTDIFTVVLMVSIVLVLLAYLNVFPGTVQDEGSASYIVLSYISVPLALISVALIDLVFPLIDNRAMLKENKFKVKAGVKIALFAAAVIFGVLFFMTDALATAITNDFVGVAIFVALYIAQFCINLDPKPEPVEEKVEEADVYAQYDEDTDDEE
ncbi:MAG: hypothetical protein J6L76_08490 [Clostridia bacterium]|nr:hypothetical protein [Clostridia bacterium]